MASQTLTIRRPDDWHVHLRDGEMLKTVAPYTARQFARAIVMPNLVPPVTTVEAASAYRERIVAAAGAGFTPLMTAYLTEDMSPDEIARGFTQGVWTAAKLYPAGATTNSASGVTDVTNIYPVLKRMQTIGMVLCVHGEVTDPQVDVFDREAVFIERVLEPLTRAFPALKIVFEHITTIQAVEFVKAMGTNVAATVTPQHLILNRNAIFAGGLRPHAYCLPVAKREEQRLAVRKAATSGSPKFFLGTDRRPAARCAASRHRQDRGSGRSLAQARRADGRRIRLDQAAPGHWRQNPPYGPVSRAAPADRGTASRAARRAGLSTRPSRRRNPRARASGPRR